jgi:hypothetical protein
MKEDVDAVIHDVKVINTASSIWTLMQDVESTSQMMPSDKMIQDFATVAAYKHG